MDDAPRPKKLRRSSDVDYSEEFAKIKCKEPECWYRAENERSLYLHNLRKHKQRRCPLCELEGSLYEIRAHFRTEHPQKTEYRCADCDFFSLDRVGLRRHRVQVHRSPDRTGSRSRSRSKTTSVNGSAPPDDTSSHPGDVSSCFNDATVGSDHRRTPSSAVDSDRDPEYVPEQRKRQRRRLCSSRVLPRERYSNEVEVDRETLVFVLETLRPSPPAAVQDLYLRKSGRLRERENGDGDLADSGISNAGTVGDMSDKSAPASGPSDKPVSDPDDAPVCDSGGAPTSDPGDAPALVPYDMPTSDPVEAPVSDHVEAPVSDPADTPVSDHGDALDGEHQNTTDGTSVVGNTAAASEPDTCEPDSTPVQAASANVHSGVESRPKRKWYPGRRWILHLMPDEERYLQDMERHQGLRFQMCVAVQHSFCSEDRAQLLDAYSAIVLASPFVPRIVWELGLSIAVTSGDTELVWAVTKHFMRNSALDRETVILAAASALLAAGHRTEALQLADRITFQRRSRNVGPAGGLVKVLRQFATILLRDKRVAVGAQAQLLQQKLEMVLEDSTQRPALLPLLSNVKHVVASSKKEKKRPKDLRRSILGRGSLFA